MPTRSPITSPASPAFPAATPATPATPDDAHVGPLGRRADVRLAPAPLWAIAGGVALAALPFLVAAWWAAGAGFVSAAHAELVVAHLQVPGRSDGGLGGTPAAIGPALLGALAATPWRLSVLACLLSGAVVVVMWRDVARTALPAWQQATLVAGAGLVPSIAFLASERVGEIVLLLVYLLAWRGYVQFLGGETAGGFTAGLWLGLGVVVQPRIALFALPLAALAPLYTRPERDDPPDQRRRARWCAALVVGFPTLVALGALGVVALLGSDAALPWTGQGSGDPGFVEAMIDTVADVTLLPAYVAIAVLATRRRGWRGVLPFVIPPLVIAADRVAGGAFDQPLALATLVVVAAGSLPSRLGRVEGWLVVVAAVAQVALAWSIAPRSAEVEAWRLAVLDGSGGPAAEGADVVAGWLAGRDGGSVLADPPDDLIARMGTAGPLLLPAEDGFRAALADPAAVAAIVVTDDPDDDVAAALGDRTPAGFDETLRWPGGRLLERRTATTGGGGGPRSKEEAPQ